MRKLIMWNMVTLDGLFDGSKPWDLHWHDYGWGEELEKFSHDQLETADAVLFGRKTYEGMAAYWSKESGTTADYMNNIRKYVFSRTLNAADWKNTTLIKENAEQAVRKLKEQPGKDLFIFGSAEFSAAMMAAGLIDEYRIGMNPVVLGSGRPLFKPGADELRLQLLDAKPMSTGLVLLRYKPWKGESGAD